MRCFCADFFTSCINLRLSVAVAVMFCAYTLSFMGWGVGWWLLYKCVHFSCLATHVLLQYLRVYHLAFLPFRTGLQVRSQLPDRLR